MSPRTGNAKNTSTDAASRIPYFSKKLKRMLKMQDETQMPVSVAEQAELAKFKLNKLIASVKPELVDMKLRQPIAT
jgi:hypothetical protein